jgi:hypothetical protein
VQLQAAVGGRGVDALTQRAERDLPLLQSGDDVDQVVQTAAQTVQAPDDERVAGQQVLQARVEVRSGPDRPRPNILVDAFAACPLERVELQREVLPPGRHARVSLAPAGFPLVLLIAGAIVSEPPDETAWRDVGLEVSMWTGDEPENAGITVDVRGRLHGVP